MDESLPEAFANSVDCKGIMLVFAHILTVGPPEDVQHMTHAVCLANCPNHLQYANGLLQHSHNHILQSIANSNNYLADRFSKTELEGN